MNARSIFIVSIVVIVIDRITKNLAVKYLDYTTNTGAAFGILKDQQWLFILVAVAVSIALLYCIPKYKYPELGLLLGGALGNLIDRAIYGHVIDFINLGFWPSFNIADSSNTISIILLIWRLEIKPRMRKLYK